MSFLGGIIGGGLGLLGDMFGSNSARDAQRDANRANAQLAKDNRDFTERMSNTAVQRAADDIERAGGNRALAFTTGREASTPVVSPARMDPLPRYDVKPAQHAATALQLAQMKAQTDLTTQQARVNKVEADIREELMGKERDTRWNRFVEQQDWDDLKTKIMRSQDASSAIGVKQLEQTWEHLVRTAKNQADKGSLDVAQLKSIVETFGLGAEAKTDILTKLSRLIYMMISGSKP